MKLTTKKIYKLIQEQIDEKAAKGIQTVIAKGNIPERYAFFIREYRTGYNLMH